jgi:putative inorganic carbon (HCO3(-)) transporter
MNEEERKGVGVRILKCVPRVVQARTPLDGPIGLLLLMVPISLWATFDIGFSLPKATCLLLGVAVFYATTEYARDLEHLHRALVAFFSIGSGVAALAILGTNWLYKAPLLADTVRQFPKWIRGLPGAAEGFHPNEVAGVLLWFVPVQIALLVSCWRGHRLKGWRAVALVFSTALTSLTLILTQSRGGWLGLVVGLALIGAWANRRVRIGALLLAVVLLAVVGMRGPAWFGTVVFGEATAEVVGTFNWAFRVQVWQAALWGIRDFPFTGMGLGTFRRVARVLYPLAIPTSYDIAHAHNGFLQAGVDFGVPGLVAYTSIWLLAGALLATSARGAQGRLRTLAMGLGGSLLSSFVFNLTDTVALGAKPGPAWWMMLGLIVSVFRLVQRRGAEESC